MRDLSEVSVTEGIGWFFFVFAETGLFAVVLHEFVRQIRIMAAKHA